MPATPIATLKNWFLTGLKPLQSQFHAWLDSYWHKDDTIPMNKIDGLNLNNYVTVAQLNLLAAQLVTINGAVNDYVLINFPVRTTVREIEIESQFDGHVKVGVDINNAEYGEDDYLASSVVTILVNRVFKANEGFYISTTNPANYIIRKA